MSEIAPFAITGVFLAGMFLLYCILCPAPRKKRTEEHEDK